MRKAWVQRSRKKSRRLFNRVPNAAGASEWYDYKLALSAYEKALRAAKRKSWLKFYDEVKDFKARAKRKKALAKDPFFPEMLRRENGT